MSNFAAEPHHRNSWRLWFGAFCFTLISTAAYVIFAGSVRLNLDELWREVVIGPGSQSTNGAIFWQIRLPRAVCALLVGGTLGCVGSAFQALFCNPLAEPYVIGISSGAALGGVIALLTGAAGAFGFLGMTLFAFVGGVLALALVLGLANGNGQIKSQNLLLAGIAVGTLLSALLSMSLVLGGRDSGQVLRWLLGSITPAFWPVNGVLLVQLLIGTTLLTRWAPKLNALSLGQSAASSLGIDPNKFAIYVLILGTAMTSVTVGAVGILGFVGLAAPHLARLLVGVNWNRALPLATLIGANLVLVADLLCQRIVPGIEIQVGILTSILGAPSLLFLLRKQSQP